MNIEQQVCSLELAKRLKELGVKQESYVYWCEVVVLGAEDGNPDGIRYELLYVGSPNQNPVSAFTVAELGEMLRTRMEGTWNNLSGTWTCEFLIDDKSVYESGETEAEARAKALIYLRENNLR